MQVVAAPLDLEVGIVFQMIGQKTQSELERNEADSIVEIGIVGGREKAACLGQIGREQGAADVEIEADVIEISGRFANRVGARAQAVPDVVVDQTGLDGVEIDQAHHAPAFGIEQ